MILIKRTDSTDFWTVYHRSLGNSESITLNSTGAKFGTWNLTVHRQQALSLQWPLATQTPTTALTLLTFSPTTINRLARVAMKVLLNAEVTRATSTTDFTVIDLGFEPQFVLLRCTSRSGGHGGGWYLLDSMRGYLQALGIILCKHKKQMLKTDNYSNNPGDAVNMDLTPTGFQLTTNASSSNESGANYIYMAIRRPHKPPTAGTEVFSVDDQSSGGGSGSVSFSLPSFPIDLMIGKRKSSIGS